jgi:hypothetical protein
MQPTLARGTRRCGYDEEQELGNRDLRTEKR